MLTASITACIPCYNAERTLPLAVRCIRAQSRPVRELIIIDDGSTDHSRHLAESAADRVIALPKNSGRGAARQCAFERSDSEFVLFCDATVALEPAFLEQALTHFQSETVAAVFGVVNDPNPRGFLDRWRSRHLFKTGARNAIERRASLMTGGTLLRRSVILEAGGFNRSLRAGEDQELGARLLKSGFEVICDPRLRLCALRRDSLAALLQRYARWNCAPGHKPSLGEYSKSIAYHLSLAGKDLARLDPFCAALTLFAPHYIFWSRRFLKRECPDHPGSHRPSYSHAA